MNRYYKIRRDTEVGQKLTALLSVLPKCRREAKKLCQKYNFQCYREGYWTYAGGISAFSNPIQDVDLKLFKKTKHCDYEPRLNVKTGKEIKKEMDAVPRLERDAVNKVFGLDIFAGLGLIINNKEFVGVCFKDSKEYKPEIPSYAIEITASEYEKLSKL